MGELGCRKPHGEVRRLGAVEPQIVGAVEDVGIGDFARRAADRNFDVIILDQIAQLLRDIFAEQVRPGDAGRIAAGLVEPAIGARRKVGRAAIGIVDPQLGIGKAALGACLGVGSLAILEVARQSGAQAGDRLVVHLAKAIDDLGDVVDRGDDALFLVHAPRHSASRADMSNLEGRSLTYRSPMMRGSARGEPQASSKAAIAGADSPISKTLSKL